MKYAVAIGGFLLCTMAVVIVIGTIALGITIVERMGGREVSASFWPITWFIAVVIAFPSGVHSYRATIRRDDSKRNVAKNSNA